jgi:hypothetical protein
MSRSRSDVPPSNEALRHPRPNLVDQRQQQIDPAGRQRRDDNLRPDTNRKQPGGNDPRLEPSEKDPPK